MQVYEACALSQMISDLIDRSLASEKILGNFYSRMIATPYNCTNQAFSIIYEYGSQDSQLKVQRIEPYELYDAFDGQIDAMDLLKLSGQWLR